jgi:hypothetical protein
MCGPEAEKNIDPVNVDPARVLSCWLHAYI